MISYYIFIDCMSKIERNLFLLCFASLKGERKKISKTYVTQGIWSLLYSSSGSKEL